MFRFAAPALQGELELNISATARYLGVSRKTLREKIEFDPSSPRLLLSGEGGYRLKPLGEMRVLPAVTSDRA